MADSRRAEALKLAEEVLGELELSQIDPGQAALKTSRLARLLDDVEAMQWLGYEVAGYPTPLDAGAIRAAERSRRRTNPAEDGSMRWWTGHVASMAAEIDSARVDLAGYEGASLSGDFVRLTEQDRSSRRNSLLQIITHRSGTVAQIIGAFHAYVADRYQELRFGAAVETAFEVVRAEVDGRLADLVPEALPMVSAAFENAVSENPEHWAGAAATCRRLIKAVADALRPVGEDVEGRRMGDEQYINRLVDWVQQQATSDTMRSLVTADIEYLGQRLDAVTQAGHKGAHATVSRAEASRFIAGTYLLLGDVLALTDNTPAVAD